MVINWNSLFPNVRITPYPIVRADNTIAGCLNSFSSCLMKLKIFSFNFNLTIISVIWIMTKTCLVTGITSGIGKATVFKLAKKNISLILISKNEKKVNKVCDQIFKINNDISIKPYICDISSLMQVKDVAKDIKADFNSIDIMINNAGALFNRYHLSEDGYELTFATNYLGSFLLTLLLLNVKL